MPLLLGAEELNRSREARPPPRRSWLPSAPSRSPATSPMTSRTHTIKTSLFIVDSFLHGRSGRMPPISKKRADLPIRLRAGPFWRKKLRPLPKYRVPGSQPWEIRDPPAMAAWVGCYPRSGRTGRSRGNRTRKLVDDTGLGWCRRSSRRAAPRCAGRWTDPARRSCGSSFVLKNGS